MGRRRSVTFNILEYYFLKEFMENITATTKECSAIKSVEIAGLEEIHDLSKKRKSVFLQAECSTSKRAIQEYISEENTGCIVKHRESAETRINQKSSTTIEDLPFVLLENIFSFLVLDDLINVQLVCEIWGDTINNTLLWRYAPLVLYNNNNLEKLSCVPYLHTITGDFFYGNKVFEVLINHVIDLRRMDCAFMVVPLPEVAQKFVEKFKNLEFIKLTNHYPLPDYEMSESDTCPDFELSLYYYNACSKLKSLRLFDFFYFQHFSHICRIIGEGFHALKCLNILRLHCPIENKSDLSNLLKRKIHQLTALHLSSRDVNHDILELIFRSTMLKKLEIIIYEWPKTRLDLQAMTELMSLIVTFEFQFLESFTLIPVNKRILFPKNLEQLEIYFTSSVKPYTGIISDVISSLPGLKEFTIRGIGDWDIDQQLEKINSLPNLHTVSLDCPDLSSTGVENVMKCVKLRELSFSGVTITHSTLECLKKCRYLSHLEIFSCILNLNEFSSTILNMEYLMDIFIINCNYRTIETDRLALIEDYMFNNLRMEYRRKKHNVRIQMRMRV